jgi:aminopeptidase
LVDVRAEVPGRYLGLSVSVSTLQQQIRDLQLAARLHFTTMKDPRLERLADVLVNYSIAVQPGQLIRLSSPAQGIPLLSELTRAVLRAGGHPMLRLNFDAFDEQMLAHGSVEQLKYVNPVALNEVEKIDGHIAIWAEENTRHLTRADPERLGIYQAARKPIFTRFVTRAAEGKLKWVGTQFPTQAHAQDADMSLEEYENFVFSAGLLDHPDPIAAWKRISQTQQRLVDYLNGKHDYRVVASNGTDVRMSLTGRTWINCGGHENFPDGEVFSGPVVDSVEGQINFSFPAVHLGHEVTDVRLTFRHGKVVDASASKGQDFLYKMLDMDAGARFLGECAIGCNYGITQYTRNTLFDEKIGGTVHFAVGAGYPESGNTNQSGLHWDMVVDLRKGGSVEVDGEKIVVDGTFTRDGMPKGHR